MIKKEMREPIFNKNPNREPLFQNPSGNFWNLATAFCFYGFAFMLFLFGVGMFAIVWETSRFAGISDIIFAIIWPIVFLPLAYWMFKKGVRIQLGK